MDVTQNSDLSFELLMDFWILSFHSHGGRSGKKVYGPIGRLFPLAVRWSKIGDFLPNFDRLDEEKATSSDWVNKYFLIQFGCVGNDRGEKRVKSSKLRS